MGNFLENIIKAASEGGTLNEIVKTAADGGSLGDIINVATDNESVGDLIKKVAKSKEREDRDDEDVVEEETYGETEVEDEEEYVEEETGMEEVSNGGFGSVIGGMLKNVDLGELAKGVISVIGLAGGALKK